MFIALYYFQMIGTDVFRNHINTDFTMPKIGYIENK